MLDDFGTAGLAFPENAENGKTSVAFTAEGC
jgi:hypothetical protein